MVWKEIRHLNATVTKLKQFGYLLGALFLIFGFYKGIVKKDSIGFLGVFFGVAFLLTAHFKPRILDSPYRLWMGLALLLGTVVTPIILTLFFYGILSPFALLSRMLGKRFLELRFRDPATPSYWLNREVRKWEKKFFEKQY